MQGKGGRLCRPLRRCSDALWRLADPVRAAVRDKAYAAACHFTLSRGTRACLCGRASKQALPRGLDS